MRTFLSFAAPLRRHFSTTVAPSGREKFQTSFVLTQTISVRGATGAAKPCCSALVVIRGAPVIVGGGDGLVEP